MPTYMDVIDRMADGYIEKVAELKALKKENRLLKCQIKKLYSDKDEFKKERNEYRREVERLKKELSLVI